MDFLKEYMFHAMENQLGVLKIKEKFSKLRNSDLKRGYSPPGIQYPSGRFLSNMVSSGRDFWLGICALDCGEPAKVKEIYIKTVEN